ncbi:relaxase/mobilization nuclease and DUF3363 domain-containing protein [Sphingomonas sp. So64.6b]|uniref:relaxase/mobilization nuclease RlxS n=1 Tax=Sphingomonas sp. So64.6b TaxID=2997354 RepID=UPI00160198E8|nr:relaxase/mobilization nuclease RlxS [Sphingomonas sp. So64.6b]QNA82953.1 relaxase/mobilization nuclease and DUF3363 domain-containing protein [Sphingomonas sp. So64.6b]
MADDDFDLWLGRVAADRPLLHRMRAAINRAGGMNRRTRSGFTGARIGRGSGVGRILAGTGTSNGSSGRRVIVKARIVKLAGKGFAGATAHLRYLQRDGTTREGEGGTLYGPEQDAADGKAFLERGNGDRHQFRFIVAPEDGAEYENLKPLVRRWMKQVEQDLGTKLDWVAVDHFNTGHPHSHVIVRGKDHLGKDLILAREYMTQGLRARAAALVDLDLGPRTAAEIDRANRREIDQERLTNIDRRLLAARDAGGLVSPAHPDGVEQSLRAGRLQTLARMGLATEERRGSWRLDANLTATLTRIGERNDIIRTMQRTLTERAPECSPADYAIFDASNAPDKAIVGKVVARGLSDEANDRHYLIVDGIDGQSHYVDLGVDAAPTMMQSLVRVAPVSVAAREVDRTVAEIAAANNGTYSVDLHLRHDPVATNSFAQTHERRLEAIRRTTGGVERNPDGSWTIAADHVARAEAYERERAGRNPVTIETLSTRAIGVLPTHDGATWLDRELVAERPVELGRGFGADVRQALALRRQWLIEQGFAETEGDTMRYRRNMLALLQQRELGSVAGRLSAELDKPFIEARSGQAIEGIYRRSIQVGDARFALIEKSREFTLVPWRPVLERSIGKPVSGIIREGGISWTIGRSRGLGIS